MIIDITEIKRKDPFIEVNPYQFSKTETLKIDKLWSDVKLLRSESTDEC